MRTTSMRKIGLLVLLLVAPALLVGAATTMNTGQVKYRFPATGAVTRDLTARLSDTASVVDFGAACNGSTDDTAAVNKAIATGKPVTTPATACRTTGPLGLVPGGSIILNGTDIHTVGGDLGGTLPNPVVVATHLAAPLPLSSGGTGVATLGPCGAGVVTSDGNTLSCTALSGLAPPGTTGVLLQSAFPGSPQVGNFNINGTATFGVTCLTQFCQGTYIKNVGNSLGFYPADFNTNLTGSRASQYSFYGPQGNASILDLKWIRSTTGSGQIQMRLGGCDDSNTCITTNLGGANTALYLSGSTGVGQNRVVVTTSRINVTSGNIFEVQNNTTGTIEAAVAFNGNFTAAGTVTTTGVTSSGPVSGTTGTFSGGVTSSGPISGTTGTFTGGATIGSGGAVISSTFRGTANITPALLAPDTCNTFNITVTGAVAGADCVTSFPGAITAAVDALPNICWVTTNTCNLKICNSFSTNQSAPAGLYACRVFNP